MSVDIQPTTNLSDLITLAGDAKLDARKIDMLDWCQKMSAELYEGRIDGDLVCVFGLIPPSLISTQAYLWMHATDRVEDHKFLFVRHSQLAIERMLTRYEVIIGHCVVGAESSIRWVRWLGGVFGEPYGPYLPFKIERGDGPV